jgi:putative ABC transport system permease protein
MIGVVGSVIGASLGVLAAYVVSSTFMTTGFGFDVAFSVHWPTVGASLAVGVGVVALASLPALFRTLRISVVQGLGGPGIAADFGRSVLDRSLMGIRGLPRVAQMGIRNALRRRGRSVATALQVAFAVGVVIAMLNLGAGIYDATIGAYDHRTWDVSTYLADSPADPMTVGRSSTIEEIAGVRSVEPILFSSAEVSGRTVSLYGYVHDTTALDDLARLLDDGQGRWWTPEEAAASARVVVIGDALSKLEGIELGDDLDLMTATGRHEFEVIGIDTSFMENGKFLYAPLETIQDVLQRGDSVNGFFIDTTTRDHREIDAISLRISERLADLGYRADTTINYVAAEQNVAQNQALSRLFLMVSFIVVLIVLVGLMSTLVMNILDRTKEIGMLRCIGARSKDVRRVFSSEGLFLALLGWVVGLPLGYAVYQLIVVGLAGGMKLTLPARYDLLYVGWSLVFALAGTLIVIFFPLRRAARMMPGEALRYE